MRTETYDLREELDAIESERQTLAEDLAAAAVEGDDEVDVAALADDAERGQELDRYRAGLAWALNEDAAGDDRARDAYESVTISELTAGSYIKAGAEADADAQDLDLPAGGDVERLYRVANAVDSADFLDDHTDPLVAVANLKPQFFFWLEDRVNELTTPEIEGNSFGQLVAETAESLESASGDASTSSSRE